MKFQKKEIELKNGKKCMLVSADPHMASSMIRYRKKMTGETYYSVFYPDEIYDDVEVERHIMDRRMCKFSQIEMVATINNKIVGTSYVCEYAELRKIQHRASLSISVLKEYWNLGIGTSMMEYMIELARKAGYQQLDIEVVDDNERALKLYKKLGFIETGRRHNSICLGDDKYCDEIIMYFDLSIKHGEDFTRR